MINRVPLTAAAGWGASLMTRVDAVSEAGPSPWHLAECGRTADHWPSETAHPGNLGLDRVDDYLLTLKGNQRKVRC